MVHSASWRSRTNGHRRPWLQVVRGPIKPGRNLDMTASGSHDLAWAGWVVTSGQSSRHDSAACAGSRATADGSSVTSPVSLVSAQVRGGGDHRLDRTGESGRRRREQLRRLSRASSPRRQHDTTRVRRGRGRVGCTASQPVPGVVAVARDGELGALPTNRDHRRLLARRLRHAGQREARDARDVVRCTHHVVVRRWAPSRSR